jgi:HSP20 family protein
MARERSKNREESQAVERRQAGHMSRPDTWSPLSPFSMMRRFADEMDRMFGGFGFPGLERFTPSFAMEHFAPQVDIFERDGKMVISADLPGMTKDDVNVDITDDSVVIEGERKYEHEENKEGLYRTERSYGSFRRQIALPEGVNSENAKATFKNGVLEIQLDAPQMSKNRRRIQIEGEEKDRTPGKSAA